MTAVVELDIIVLGGGIAGLWLLSRLRAEGYGALLVERSTLGAGQSICAQGIIHGGSKYALGGRLTEASRRIGAMPELWRRCLDGRGEVDLSTAQLLSPHQYLWTPQSLSARVAGFLASHALRSRMTAVSRSDFPSPLRHPHFRGNVYRLDEPVVEVGSVLRALATSQREAIVHTSSPTTPNSDASLLLQAPQHPPLLLRAQRIVVTAGAGNEQWQQQAMQRRPLHMVMARGDGLDGDFYAHCLGTGTVPRLTITTHRHRTGQTIYYLGGQLAEEGVSRGPEEQAAAARRELATVLPWMDLTGVQFAAFTIDRAEARQPDGKRPDGPELRQTGRIITAWPTKLALAPLLATQVLARLRESGLQARHHPVPALPEDWPRPAIATYPWDREDLSWF